MSRLWRHHLRVARIMGRSPKETKRTPRIPPIKRTREQLAEEIFQSLGSGENLSISEVAHLVQCSKSTARFYLTLFVDDEIVLKSIATDAYRTPKYRRIDQGTTKAEQMKTIRSGSGALHVENQS